MNSYMRAANIWLRQLPDKLRMKERITKERIENKVNCIYEDLKINKRFTINGEMIKEKIGLEHNIKGFWNF